MFNVEKVIRVLGYVVYTILWSPVIVLCLTVMPFIYGGMCVRNGKPIGNLFTMFKDALVNGVRHDMEFIQTGIW